ncbi:MAG: arginine--tRNA ligase [Alphaproteobacteria bacterium]|nr:arginine--tRNA ligase [Alphaproteobacteria bacterium]
MSTLSQTLTELVQVAAAAAGHADAPVALEPCVPTTDPAHGDYQSNHAFRLGKALRTNPRQVAEAVRAALPAHPLVASVEVAGPGFLNFRLDDAALADALATAAADPRFGAPLPGAGRTLVIDYSSPNIAKRMHVGHMRSTLIGQALDRMFRFLGYAVVSDNHLGDWGTPFGMLIVAWDRWRDEEAFGDDPVAELLRLYQRFRAEAADDPALMEQARAETANLQAGEPRARSLWERFVAVSMAEFDQVYRRLGVRFDETLGESAYDAMLPGVVDDLLARGIAVEDEGAVIVRFDEADGKGLKDAVAVVRKRDGAATYTTTDVATIRYRMDRWTPDVIVYVTDVRQKQHFQQLFAIAARLGVQADLRHVAFGMLKLADGQVAASRSGGGLVSLVEVLDEAVRRARAVVDQRADEIPDEAERAAIAEAVGLGAVRYADLSQNPQSDVTFDWDKMLALTGNTAVYLLYAHARCWSMLRTAGVDPGTPRPLALIDPTERTLALSLLRLPEIVATAAEAARPNLLADHLFGLAQDFSAFYLACPVLKDDVEPAVREARLGLVAATARGMALGLELLGLTPLQRM